MKCILCFAQKIIYVQIKMPSCNIKCGSAPSFVDGMKPKTGIQKSDYLDLETVLNVISAYHQ